MAIYDRDATPATAVTAFLAQFQCLANGNVRYVSGTDTFHVWWLHRALQKIVYDFAISGDDELNLSKPNPSTSEALGTIITLIDHTTDYTTRYNIDDTVAEYLFGGSVEQQNVSSQTEGYYGLKVVGAAPAGTELQIVQDAGVLTSHWGTGKNQTEAGTLLRILVKAQTAGADIDNKVVVVRAHEWGDTHGFWEQPLGLGEATAAINTESDPQNDTLRATVSAYAITPNEGYKLLDLDNNGNKPYLGEWNYGAYNKKALYEFVKDILTRSTAKTLYGVDGDLWTNRVYDCTISSGSGTWVQNETLSWGSGATAGTGHLMGVDDTAGASTGRLILHLDTGVFPEAALTITGAGAATGVVSGTPAKLSVHPTHLGQFTGAWIGAYGIGFTSTQVTVADSFTDLDGNPISPPNNVPLGVTVIVGNAGDTPHVFLARKDGVLNAPDITQYTAASGNNSGNGTFVVNEAIASDEPQTGYILILATGDNTYEAYEYTSWSVSTFTLAGTLSQNITLNDDAFPAYFYEEATGGGTTKTVSNSLIHSSDITVIGWVRHGDPAAPDKPVPIGGTITGAGFNTSVTLEDET